MTMGTLYQRYEQELRRRGRKPESIETTMRRVRAWFEDDTEPADISAKRAEEYYKTRCDQVAVATHHSDLREAKGFWKWVVSQRFCRVSPVAHIKPLGRPNRGKPQLTRSEARVFVVRCLQEGTPASTAALCCLVLGLRSGEILGRRVRDVDVAPEGVILYVPYGKTDAARRQVEVPQPLAYMLAYLVVRRDPQEWLFPGDTDSGHRRKEWLHGNVRRLCEAAGVPVVSPHGLRGTHTTLAARRGVAAETVAKEIGHTSADVTRRHYMAPGSEEASNIRRVGKLLEYPHPDPKEGK